MPKIVKNYKHKPRIKDFLKIILSNEQSKTQSYVRIKKFTLNTFHIKPGENNQFLKWKRLEYKVFGIFP